MKKPKLHTENNQMIDYDQKRVEYSTDFNPSPIPQKESPKHPVSYLFYSVVAILMFATFRTFTYTWTQNKEVFMRCKQLPEMSMYRAEQSKKTGETLIQCTILKNP